MPDSNEPIVPKFIPDDEGLKRVISSRNHSLMYQQEAERREAFYSGQVNQNDPVEPELAAENRRLAAQYRAEVAQYDRELARRNYDPDSHS